jgi:hypothetical protein
MKKGTLEEVTLNLELESTNEEVKKALIRVCGDNTKLKRFINKFFKANTDATIYAWDDYGWEWDLEIDGGIEGGTLAFCNHDNRDDEYYEGDGWELSYLEESFALYFDTFNHWDKVTLPNGKVLMLLDEDDYYAFQILDRDKIEDGKVDYWGLS